MKLVSLPGFALQSYQRRRKVGDGSHYPFVNCAEQSLLIHLWPYRFLEEFTVSLWQGGIALNWKAMESINLFKLHIPLSSSHLSAFLLITTFIPIFPSSFLHSFHHWPLSFVKGAQQRFYKSHSVYSSWGVLLSLWKPFHSVSCGRRGEPSKAWKNNRDDQTWPWRLQIYNRNPHRNWRRGDEETWVFSRKRPRCNDRCYQVALQEKGYITDSGLFPFSTPSDLINYLFFSSLTFLSLSYYNCRLYLTRVRKDRSWE